MRKKAMLKKYSTIIILGLVGYIAYTKKDEIMGMMKKKSETDVEPIIDEVELESED